MQVYLQGKKILEVELLDSEVCAFKILDRYFRSIDIAKSPCKKLVTICNPISHE